MYSATFKSNKKNTKEKHDLNFLILNFIIALHYFVTYERGKTYSKFARKVDG